MTVFLYIAGFFGVNLHSGFDQYGATIPSFPLSSHRTPSLLCHIFSFRSSGLEPATAPRLDGVRIVKHPTLGIDRCTYTSPPTDRPFCRIKGSGLWKYETGSNGRHAYVGSPLWSAWPAVHTDLCTEILLILMERGECQSRRAQW